MILFSDLKVESARRPEFQAAGVRCMAFLPLISRGVPLGVLYLGTSDINGFSPEEQQILKLYAIKQQSQ